ncbi:MAG: hypothetical protein LBR07_00965 [Puniceicoccales bacterium]|jgi:hypothetical protein|nr:hypothetical protein [Puniceicoccales bacterium]
MSPTHSNTRKTALLRRCATFLAGALALAASTTGGVAQELPPELPPEILPDETTPAPAPGQPTLPRPAAPVQTPGQSQPTSSPTGDLSALRGENEALRKQNNALRANYRTLYALWKKQAEAPQTLGKKETITDTERRLNSTIYKQEVRIRFLESENKKLSASTLGARNAELLSENEALREKHNILQTRLKEEFRLYRTGLFFIEGKRAYQISPPIFDGGNDIYKIYYTGLHQRYHFGVVLHNNGAISRILYDERFFDCLSNEEYVVKTIAEEMRGFDDRKFRITVYSTGRCEIKHVRSN